MTSIHPCERRSPSSFAIVSAAGVLLATTGCGNVALGTTGAGGAFNGGGAGTSTSSAGGAGGASQGCGGNDPGTGGRISSALGGFLGPAPWEELQNVNSMNCARPAAVKVLAKGVTVTAVDTWDESGKGSVGTVYVQDTVSPAPTYAGLSLVAPTYSPPDLSIQPGDVVDVAGTYDEYTGPSNLAVGSFSACETRPQIEGSVSLRCAGEVPAPIVITPDALVSYAEARRYLGMLVTVSNVTLQTSGAEIGARYAAQVQADSGRPWSVDDELWDVPHLMPLSAGQHFQSVTGIVTFLDSFYLAPRSAADFVP